MQFDEFYDKDAHAQLNQFKKLCLTLKFTKAPEDVYRLMLVPFSRRSKTSEWLKSLSTCTSTSWDSLVMDFLSRYCPIEWMIRLKNDFLSYAQIEGEYLYETWEHLKKLLWKCPTHELSLLQ